ncbi:MAG: Uma2 family endonuclease [Betaproteobacteria bacterium]
MQLEEAVLDQETLTRRWHELAGDPNSPDYYEVNEFGEVIMSPRPTNDHQRVVTAVTTALNQQLGPEAVQEVSIITDRGIRVPDVVWMNPERWLDAKGKTPLPFVPDVCVEVLSPGNTKEEVTMKANAYLRGGAREVIIVSLRGEVDYLGSEGKRTASALGIRVSFPSALF